MSSVRPPAGPLEAKPDRCAQHHQRSTARSGTGPAAAAPSAWTKVLFVLGSHRTGEFRPSPVRSRKDPQDGQQIAGRGSPRLDGHGNDPCAMVNNQNGPSAPHLSRRQRHAAAARPAPSRVGARIPRVAWTMATIGKRGSVKAPLTAPMRRGWPREPRRPSWRSRCGQACATAKRTRAIRPTEPECPIAKRTRVTKADLPERATTKRTRAEQLRASVGRADGVRITRWPPVLDDVLVKCRSPVA
jgi:hypothetical protein